jgi:hypothetical protein
MVTYVIVSPLSTTAKLLRVKNDSISPATMFGALFPFSSINVFFTIYIYPQQTKINIVTTTTIVIIKKQSVNEQTNELLWI